MTEDDARAAITAQFGAAASERIGAFLTMVVAENERQNLISPSTVAAIWSRHALDSLQLMNFARNDAGRWLDIGTGGGFPGLVIALASDVEMTLVEPRARRAAFLKDCVERLGLGARIGIRACKIERVQEVAATISARAVASVENLLRLSAQCATPATRWVLPRGRLDGAEVAILKRTWRFVFHVEQSITDPSSSILILDGVSPR